MTLNYSLARYTIFHPTKQVFTSRGCIIYIKGTLKEYKIKSQETEFIEFIQAGIKTQSGSNIMISCIYRSPSANNDDCVRELSDIISIKKFCNTKFDCIWVISILKRSTWLTKIHQLGSYIYLLSS